MREGKPSARWPQRHRWYRPRATKKMTVELAREGQGQGVFVWPEELNEEEGLTAYVFPLSIYNSNPFALRLCFAVVLHPISHALM